MPATARLAHAQHTLGAEFQVNSSTLLRQRYPAVAIEADGDFIIAWNRAGTGNLPDIFFRRFTSAGVGLASDVTLNVFMVGTQYGATVDVAADGRLVIAWTSNAQDGDFGGVFARRLDAAGMPLATEFQVNTLTARDDYDPALAVSASGDFVVVWSGYDNAEYRPDVFGQRFDSAGAKLDGEFHLNSQDFDYEPAIGMDASGGFVVVWSSYREDTSSLDVFARRFDSAGTSIGGEFQVNTSTADQQSRPDLAVGADGRFVVAWSGVDQDGAFLDIFAQRFSSSGVKVGAEFLVNAYTANHQREPMVDVDGDGDFVVTWSSGGQDDPLAPSTAGVFGQRFDSSGATIAVEFQVNSYTSNHQRYPAVGVDSDGDFVVSWESFGQDGANEGLFAQRFATTPGAIQLDADGNGSLEPLTDGLLVLRHFFGFTGPTLVNGAIGEGCSRCDGPAVATYLTGLGLTLDIDGDLSLGPLTDGLLVLRYLFGFTGSTLVNGAIGEDCTRCDAGMITTYLQSID